MNSKSKRKFRVWDNKLIFTTLQKVIQISGKIEEKCTNEISPDMLPMSMVPTDILYDITACFEAIYDKLLEEELVTAGYQKSTQSLH